MAYTEQTTDDVIYSERLSSETRWDGGLTTWDVVGNAATTHWDETTVTYTESTGTTPTYTEQ